MTETHEEMMRLSGGEELLLEELRAVAKHLGVIDALRDDLNTALHEIQNDFRTALREIRGELAGIRARLDSLVPIEKQLGYFGQRLSAIEKRFATLVETKLESVDPGTPTYPPPLGAGEEITSAKPA